MAKKSRLITVRVDNDTSKKIKAILGTKSWEDYSMSGLIRRLIEDEYGEVVEKGRPRHLGKRKKRPMPPLRGKR